MSNNLPVAAPNPPVGQTAIKCENKLLSTKSNNPLIEECLWALDYPELQKACFLARICSINPPSKCEFRNIGSILQVGPTCGLTAISMLLGGIPPAEQLLRDAQEKHFTNNGEMFSAHQLYQLICENLPMINNNNNDNNTTNANGTYNEKTNNSTTIKNEVIECQMHEGLLKCAKVIECLRLGACLFVPCVCAAFLSMISQTILISGYCQTILTVSRNGNE